MTKTAPPARLTVAELEAGQRLEGAVFRIAQKDLRTTSNGNLYIHAVIADGTGEMLARLWNASQEIFDSIPAGGFARFRGRVENYRGHRQFIVDGVDQVEQDSIDPADFLPSTDKDVDAMWEETKKLLRTIKNPHVLALLARFLNDERFAVDFKRTPAAVNFHHAYLGGLLEHTLALLKLADVVCPLYPQVNRDIVLAGLFFHDLGKIREIASTTNFEYTDEGQMLGHIVQAVTWLHDCAGEIEAETGKPFPREIELALKHIIVAHHGKIEFGSPRLPATPEAIMIHFLDNLDAKLNMVSTAIEGDADESSDWTGYVRALENRIYKRRIPDVAGE